MAGECAGNVGCAGVSSRCGREGLSHHLPHPPRRDVSVELPFVLMHPKPHDHITLPRPQTGERTLSPPPPRGGRRQGQGRPAGPPWRLPTYPSPPAAAPDTGVPVDTNLIEFDTK